MFYIYKYPQFDLEIKGENGVWSIERLSTSTPGFGFAGVYVGIPECNKAFIEKLFSQAERIHKSKLEGVEQWKISIFELAKTEVNILFNKNGTVKRVAYSSQNYVD